MRDSGVADRAATPIVGVAGAMLALVAVLVTLQACRSASLDELLAGKACDANGMCAPGYVCEATTNRCVVAGTPGAGGTGGTGGSETGGGGDGGGGSSPCMSVQDCPPPQSLCEAPICLGGECGTSALPTGTVVAAQRIGDCKRAICDGLGGVTELNDAADLPFDGESCTDDVCNSGQPDNPPLEAGAACDRDGGDQCDGDGSCVSCLSASDCAELPPTDECQARSCEGGSCLLSFTSAGVAIAAQSPSDCQALVCDGSGSIDSSDDDFDLPDDHLPCTEDLCDQGIVSHPFKPESTPCGNGGSCNETGVCTGCTVASDCGSDSFCVQHSCDAGICVTQYTSEGTPLPAVDQTAGDCLEWQCNATGGIKVVAKASDVPPDDGNACTDEICSGFSAQHPRSPANTPCAQAGGSVCDGDGSCVECNVGSQCPIQGGACQTATCQGGTCGLANLPDGAYAPPGAQIPGDCRAIVCDGNGGSALVADPGDLPVDGNDCTLDLCSGGTPSNPPTAAGTPCGNMGTCNGAGACTSGSKPLGDPCGGDGECASGHCVDGLCCDSGCDDACETCLGTFNGGDDGSCGPVVSGEDPDDDCGGDTCDGLGGCAFFCGQAPTRPPAPCPAVCTGGCNDNTCVIACNGTSACAGANIACPAGFACMVQCGGNNSCVAATIDCPAKYACEVVCSGDCGGANVVCGSGTCELTCGAGDRCLGTTLACGANRCSAVCTLGDFPTVLCGNACDCDSCALDDGAGCATDAQCASGVCHDDDDICCDATCAGDCESCLATQTGVSSGVCAPVIANTDPANDCQGQQVCNGAGACALPGLGASCNNGNHCASGNCPPQDGVCCDTPCNGTCVSCQGSLTGLVDGACAPIMAGLDPNNECPGAATCAGNGMCQ